MGMNSEKCAKSVTIDTCTERKPEECLLSFVIQG